MYSSNLITLNDGNADIKRDEVKKSFHLTCNQHEDLFDNISENAMYMQPDPLRQPLLFYLGHTAVFYINKLLLAKAITKRVNKDFEAFFAVGVDEMSWDDMKSHDINSWPTISAVKSYRNDVKAVVSSLIDNVSIEFPITWESHLWHIIMGIEHERIHLETSSVLIRQLDISKIQYKGSWPECPQQGKIFPENQLLTVKEQSVVCNKNTTNSRYYGWDNEYGFHESQVSEFEASKYLASNGEFKKFVDSNGYNTQKYWCLDGWNWVTQMKISHPKFWLLQTTGTYKLRTIFKEIDMPWSWPVEVNYYEAKAFCNYLSDKLKKEVRLPTEDEWFSLRLGYEQDLSENSSDAAIHGNINLRYASACPVDSFSFGKFNDISGNVWQWTETSIYPFDGFKPHPSYDDFSLPTFDGKHNLIKGGSFISTGNLSDRDSRYAFRKHFFQHAGLRYVVSSNNSSYENTKGNNLYHLDEVVMQYIEMHYGAEYFSVPNYPKHCVDVIIDIIGKSNLDNALDLGCAVGRASFELAKYYDDVQAIDLSARFIQVATLLQEKGKVSYSIINEGDIKDYKEITLDKETLERSKRIKFMQGDACNLSTIKQNKDLIFAGNLLDRLNNPVIFLENIHKYLNIGGYFAISSPYTWLEEYTIKSKWIGGVKGDNGEFITTYEGMKQILSKNFQIIGLPKDLPFVIRETARKYQHSIGQLTLWKKVR